MALTAPRRPRLPFQHQHPTLYVPLTIAIWEEEGRWLSECLELGIGSFGESPDEAAAQAADAICSYLNTLEELGERGSLFAKRSIATFFAEPEEFQLHQMTRELAMREKLQLRPFEYRAALA